MEQLALDELVGLVARTQLLGRRGLGLVQLLLWLVLAKLVLGELVLIRIPAGGEISDEDQQHDERTDQPERRPVGSTHGTPNVAAALRVHYWRRPSCSLTTRSIFAARRSLWVATSAALPANEAEELPKNGVGGVFVEVAGRLVGEHQRRLVGERSGDRDPLLLPTRKLGWTVIEPLRQAEGAEQLPRPLPRCRCVGAAHQLGKNDILDG